MDPIRYTGLPPVTPPHPRTAASPVTAHGSFAASLEQTLAGSAPRGAVAAVVPSASQSSAALLGALVSLDEELALTGLSGTSASPFGMPGATSATSALAGNPLSAYGTNPAAAFPADPLTPYGSSSQSGLPLALEEAMAQSGIDAGLGMIAPTPAYAPLPGIVSALPSPAASTPPLSGVEGSTATGAYAGAQASGRTRYQAMIAAMAPGFGLDPALVNALVNRESGYHAQATSPVGAMGLMQLMPATAAALGVSQPYDPASNLRGGMTYLSQLLKQFNGNVALALAAYNAGPAAVNNYGGIPPYPETQTYVDSILNQLHPRNS